MSEPELAVGTVLFGKYRVERELGRGGMGVVVEATHLDLQEQVAIKILHGTVDEEARVRFIREARAAAKLKSEHIMRVVDVGTLASGMPYMVMELLSGRDLAALVGEGKLAPARAVDLVLQALLGMAEAHAQGFTHRDIKPANLFVTTTTDGTTVVKILDFGISKLQGDVSLTSTRAVLGTPAYMAPEQWRSASDADARSDIWSIGAVLYEMVEGVRPFPADTITEMCAQVMGDDPRPMTIEAPELRRAIAKCLEKEPADRYQTVAELARHLVPLATDPADAAKLVDRIERRLGVPVRPTPVPLAAVTKPTIDPKAETAAALPRVEPVPALPTTVRKRNRRYLYLMFGALAALGVAVIAYAAIGRQASTPELVDPPSVDPPSVVASRQGGTLRVAMNRGDETGIALYSSTASRTQHALRMVIERLADVTPDGTVMPLVLRSVTYRGDELVLELRDNVVFHGNPQLAGTPCATDHPATLDDVVYSLTLARDKHAIDLAIEKVGIEAGAVHVKLSAPAPFYPYALAEVRFVPAYLPQCKQDVDKLDHLVGTGPFELVEEGRPTKLVLIASRSYWRRALDGGRLPRLDRVELLVASPGTLRAMQQPVGAPGAIHIFSPGDDELPTYADLTALPPVLRSKAPNLELATRDGKRRYGLWYLDPTAKPGPLRSLELRQAIAYGIDRAAAVAKAQHTSRSPAAPLGRIFTRSVHGYIDGLPELSLDRAKARALVDKARASFPQQVIPPLRFGYAHDREAAEAVARSLGEIGLRVEVEQVKAQQMVLESREGGLDALFTTHWLELQGDELIDVASLARDAGPALAELHRKLATSDTRDRLPIYQQIEQKMLADLPIIPIARLDPSRITYAVILRSEVQDVYDPLGDLPLELDLSRTFTQAWLRR